MDANGATFCLYSMSETDFDEKWDQDVSRLLDGSVDSSRRTRALADFAYTRDQLNPLIRRVLADREYLAAVARRSYFHANRFEKIVLAWVGDFGPKLRLHIWQSEEFETSGLHIHDHAWDFASIVLSGALETETYRRASSGEAYYHYIVPNRANSRRKAELVTSSAKLRCAETRCIETRELYSLNCDVLHRTAPRNPGLTVTLLLQGPHVRNTTNAFLQGIIQKSRITDVRRFSTTELKKRFEWLLQHCCVVGS